MLYLLATCCCATAAAQQAPEKLPPAAQPGRQLQQPRRLEPVPEGAAIAVPEASAVNPPPGADKISFKLARLTVDGATALSANEIKAYYAERIGSVVSVADMFAVAAAIENEYRKRGYVTTRALLPEQKITSGTVRILVVEGFISEVVYSPNLGPARPQVQALLGELTKAKPVNIADIERRLLLANDLRGIQVHGTLRPAASERGASTLIVTAGRQPLDLSLIIDNRNSPFTGETEAIGRLSWNSFNRHAGTLSLQAKSAFPYRREHFAQAAYEQSIGANGLTAAVSTLAAESRPGRNLRPLDVHSTVMSAAANLAYPIVRSRRLNLRLDGSFEYSDLDTDILDTPYTRDRLRVLRVGLTYDRTDTWRGVNAGRITLSQGLDILDASPAGSEDLSRIEGRSDFTKLAAQFARLQTLSNTLSVLASLSGQMTWDSLLASEQLGLGGPEFGRGYDTSEISGDKGLVGLLELRYQPTFEASLWDAAQFFVFYDLGKIWNVGPELPRDESLASAGGGVRVQLPGRLYTSLEISQPLTHDVASEADKPTRLFFSIAMHL